MPKLWIFVLALISAVGADCASDCTTQAAGYDDQYCDTSVVVDGECNCRCKYVSAVIDDAHALCSKYNLNGRVVIDGQIFCVTCVNDDKWEFCMPLSQTKGAGPLTVNDMTCQVPDCETIYPDTTTSTPNACSPMSPNILAFLAILAAFCN